MQSIFLLGSERSGSNLLRTLLGNHSDISAPIAPHLTDVFKYRFGEYSPLNYDKKKELLNDINAYVNYEFNNWNVQFSHEREELSSLNSFIDYLNFAFSQKALKENKTNYFCKDNHNHKYALGIAKDIPNAKFIYLYRDPRDHVSSWMKSPLFLHTPYEAIIKWKTEQEEILLLKEFFCLDIYDLKYEDLIEKPEMQMTKVLEFIGVNIEESCFQTKRSNAEALKNPLWKNINKPIKKSNQGNFKKVLNHREINLIESLTSDLMLKLGYAPTTDQNWKKGNKYFFYLQQKNRKKRSLKIRAKNSSQEMSILQHKSEFIEQLFSKFN